MIHEMVQMHQMGIPNLWKLVSTRSLFCMMASVPASVMVNIRASAVYPLIVCRIVSHSFD